MVMERAIVPNGAAGALVDDDYRALVTHLPAVTYIEDPEGNDLFVSPHIVEILGYPLEEWRADPRLWEQLLHPDDRERVLQVNRRATDAAGAFALEYRMIAKDGRVVWVRDVARPEVDQSGKVLRWHGVMLDLTELREARARADDAEQRYQHIVENSPVVMYVEPYNAGSGPCAGADYIGPRIRDLTGFTSEELRADPNLWWSRIHPEDAERLREEDARTDAAGDTWNVEYRLLTKDGRTIWLRSHAELLEGDADGAGYWHGYLMDITHTKQVEADLQGTIEMLHRADSHRRQLYTRLVSIQEEERAQIARQIHDDPVQKMTAQPLRLQLLDSRHEDQAQRERLRDTLEVVSMTTRSLRRLLFDLSPPALERDGLAAALRECVAQHSDEFECRVEVTDLLPFEVPGHIRTTAFQVIREALANVRKHSRAGRVQVVLEARDRGLHASIQDDGKGFDPPNVAWQPVHLVLVSMRDRAELAGGRLDIRSAPDEGTTVELWLPVDGSGGRAPAVVSPS